MTPAQLVQLQALLVAGHPDTGAYSGDDAAAANQLNNVNRPGLTTIGSMVQYMASVKHRTQQGADGTFTPIVGRIAHVARSNAGDNPFNRDDGINPITLELQHVHACRLVVALLEAPQLAGVDLADANFPWGFVQGSGAISSAQETALRGLSNNSQSHASEVGLPRVRTADVTAARLLT